MLRHAPRWLILTVLGLTLAFYSFNMARNLGGSGSQSAQRTSGRFAVSLERTVDGDTAWFRDGSGNQLKVRFIGIDAPEMGGADYFASGLAAARLLEQATGIELEPEPSKPEDKHGRVLAWIWLAMPDGRELLLQEEMMRSGQAELYRDARGSLYFGRLERLAGN